MKNNDMRSFQIVEYKIAETDFFLMKLKESTCSTARFFDARNYLSAFLSASRSITFVLQAAMKDIPNFEEWYELHQNKLKHNDLARYFVEVRNLSQKVGYYPLTSGRIFRDENNKRQVAYFFDYLNYNDEFQSSIPQEDILTACTKYFILILELVCDCFKNFGNIIDPVQYFVYSITEGGKSLEDIEEELGYPRGWTGVDGIPNEERIQILRQEFEKDIKIDCVFEKYLGTDRFGEKTLKQNNIPVNQTIEYKYVWEDEYLKWICGFANAQGGTLIIGKNDRGETVGVKNAEKLLEDLPNKICATMGVVADVNLRKDNGLDIIEIYVPAYPNTISYHGKYYFRTGSTNQELSGYALDSLLLEKYGRTYDSMPVPHITLGDFWHDAFDIFRKKAVASKRLTTEEVAVSDNELLQSLNLTVGDYLLLAAVLVFHQTPQQWRPGAYVKIGYFTDDAEILYQDELYGALVGLADKVVDTIFTKYFIGRIRYEGLQRIDDYPMPRIALREAVLNSVLCKGLHNSDYVNHNIMPTYFVA